MTNPLSWKGIRTHPEVNPVLMIGMPGGPEILLIALVLVLLFGGTKIPALMRGMGQGIREFRKELRGSDDEDGPGDTSDSGRPQGS
jgi:sec-independent protein translocase protein TatA